jgi:hypothetical protein
MAWADRLWGAERIWGDVPELDIRVARSTIQRCAREPPLPRGGPTWRAFLRVVDQARSQGNQAKGNVKDAADTVADAVRSKTN